MALKRVLGRRSCASKEFNDLSITSIANVLKNIVVLGVNDGKMQNRSHQGLSGAGFF